MPRLRCNGTDLHSDVPSKEHEKTPPTQTIVITHLGAFEGVNQTALPNVREADDPDGDALRRARFVRLEEAEQRWRCSRREVRALM
jgi:hypothetical protein